MDNNQLYTLPPHVYRELVNSLRDTALKYAGCQQLREQISKTLSDVLVPLDPTSVPIAAAVHACSYIDALTPEIMVGDVPQIYTAPDGVKYARWHKDGMWMEWEKQSVIPQVNSSEVEPDIDMDDAGPPRAQECEHEFSHCDQVCIACGISMVQYSRERANG